MCSISDTPHHIIVLIFNFIYICTLKKLPKSDSLAKSTTILANNTLYLCIVFYTSRKYIYRIWKKIKTKSARKKWWQDYNLRYTCTWYNILVTGIRYTSIINFLKSCRTICMISAFCHFFSVNINYNLWNWTNFSKNSFLWIVPKMMP